MIHLLAQEDTEQKEQDKATSGGGSNPSPVAVSVNVVTPGWTDHQSVDTRKHT